MQPSPHFIHRTMASVDQVKFFHLIIARARALGESWLLLAQPQKSTDVHKGMLLWEPFLSKPAQITFRENKYANSWIKFIKTVPQFFCASLGRSLCHGNEHLRIDPNKLSSGHHDCSTKAFSALLTNCNVGQCWHVKAHIGACLRSAFSTFHSFGE